MVSRSIDKVYAEEMEEHAAEDEICECSVNLSVVVHMTRDVSSRLVMKSALLGGGEN